MWSMLLKVMQIFGAGSVRAALIGAGVGVASSAFILALITKLTNQSINQFSASAGTQIFNLLGIAGFDYALSVVIGALIYRATVHSLSLKFVKTS